MAVEKPGLHNVYRVTDRAFSGSSPEGDDGFRSLTDLGVKTVVSVDGAVPDILAAKKHGLRYVHLPIGYEGMSESRVVELAKAIRDLPGPVYVHCHHGKHRGPAATVAAIRALDSRCSAVQLTQFLKDAGTDPKYAGLYALAELPPPNLDDKPVAFRETANVPDLTKRMVELDETWDRLKKSPIEKDAVLFVEHYRELGRATSDRNEDFRKFLDDGLASAEKLEATVRGKRDPKDEIAKSAAVCTLCHAKFRDKQ
jgi:protein tyrosine phosphatase (PTP) superfamily phosphohydrolase (DUF442 family)